MTIPHKSMHKKDGEIIRIAYRAVIKVVIINFQKSFFKHVYKLHHLSFSIQNRFLHVDSRLMGYDGLLYLTQKPR
jgi:hypothetical protein